METETLLCVLLTILLNQKAMAKLSFVHDNYSETLKKNSMSCVSTYA